MARLNAKNNQPRRRLTKGSSLAEMPPAIFVLLLMLTFPLINLMALATAAATVITLTNNAAQSAANELTYTDGLAKMESNVIGFLGSGFAKYAHIAPVNGYNNCGVDLYTQVIPMGANSPQLIGPNSPMPPPVDTAANVYEYVAVSTFDIAPAVRMSGIPFLNKVPGLGQNFQMTFRANKMVEHAQGLPFAPPTTANYTGPTGPTTFDRSPVITTFGVTDQAGWRTPDIFAQIKNAGQTVVAVAAVNVPADPGAAGPFWTDTSLVVQPGQMVWIDTMAQGIWGQGGGTFDANGSVGDNVRQYCVDGDQVPFMLIGYIGTPPSMPYAHVNTQIYGDPRFVPSGNSLLNYPSNGMGGPLSLTNNDNWGSDSGNQFVRIIITQ